MSAVPPRGRVACDGQADEALDIIHRKVEIYAQHLAVGTADRLWRNGPECDRSPDAG
jgi:hypothetical protein